MEYILVDHTGLIHGPYLTFEAARVRADELPEWEIVNEDGELFDWAVRPIHTETASLKAAA